MKSELQQYEGLWVCLCENEVVASGKNAKAFYEEGKKRCKKPVIFQVPTKEEEIIIISNCS